MKVRPEGDRRLDDLVLLHRIGTATLEEDDAGQLCGRIVGAIQEALSVEIVSLLLVGADGRLMVGASRGLPEEIVRSTKVAPGEGVAGFVLARGEAVLVDDIDSDGRFVPSGGGNRYQTHSLLSVPILGRGEVLGVLNVNNKRSGERFDSADLHLLKAIAQQAALALENYRLIAVLQRQARELEEANRTLVRFDQARSRLVCNLSHELKTPLTSILGYVDLMLNFGDETPGGENKDYLAKIQDAGLHLEKLISGLLLLFSLDAGEGKWEARPFDLDIPIADALKAHREEIAARRLQCEVDLAEDLPQIYGDIDKITVLVHALIDNAVKFNCEAGLLRVQGRVVHRDRRSWAQLSIRNEGCTIPPEVGEEIFERFTQLGAIDHDKPAGIGVGLAICRAIAERLGGQIFLEPSSGVGTTIGVLLPLVGNDGGQDHERT